MEHLYRINDRNYLSKEQLKLSNGLDELRYSKGVLDGSIQRLQLVVPTIFDALYHTLSIDKGVVKEDAFELILTELTTNVAIADGKIYTNEDAIGMINVVKTPTFIYNVMDGAWAFKDGHYQPRHIGSFRTSMIRFVTELITSYRNRIAQFKTIEDRLLFTSYGESAKRALLVEGSEEDRRMFEVEADIRGNITTDDLITKTAEKYNHYVLLNRILSAHATRATNDLNEQDTYLTLLSTMKTARANIKLAYSNQEK